MLALVVALALLELVDHGLALLIVGRRALRLLLARAARIIVLLLGRLIAEHIEGDL